MLDLYLIRHAESEMNLRPQVIQGRSNETPLTARGAYQAECLGNRLKSANIRFDEVYSSTAKRAMDTAEIVGAKIGYAIDDIIATEELLEMDQGDWEQRIRAEIYTPEVLALLYADNWNFTPPNGESQRDVEERLLGWLRSLESRPEQGSIIGAYTHGMAIKCLLRGIMDFSPKMTYNLIVDNTSITRLRFFKRGWHILGLNDRCHI